MPSPMHIISAEHVYRICSWHNLMDALSRAHYHERPLVDRLVIDSTVDASTQTYINLAAWLPGKAFASKIITILPGNPSKGTGLPAIQALVTLFDGATGSPRAIIDGTSLTYVKTAADSALGSRLLSRSDASQLTLVGTGGLAPYVVRAHLAARPSISTVNVWGRRRQAAEAVASALAAQGVIVNVVDELQPAVEGADIISCVTSTQVPLVKGKWLKPGSHLDLIGSYTPEMRECDDEAIRRARVFVDSPWSAVTQSGDICGPLSRGIITAADIEANLYDLCSGKFSLDRKAEDITVFKNGGGAHLDLYTALFIAEQYEAAK